MTELHSHTHSPQDRAFDRLVDSLKDGSGSDDRRSAQPAAKHRDRQDVSLAIMTELAPLMAVRLLQRCAEVDQPAAQGASLPHAGQLPSPPALLCIGAGVVETDRPGWVRVHLQFDADLTLPVEIPRTAVQALVRVLQQQLRE